MNNKRRAQRPKRYDRHTSKQIRRLSGDGMSAPRYDRTDERTMLQRGRYDVS